MNIHPPIKFLDPRTTVDGSPRATVKLMHLETLWFNTGTLCNLECKDCYIESSPKNDRLVYLTANEISVFLDEIERDHLGTREIGFTGGEPFMNPDIVAMMTDCLERGFEVLVLTNGMRPMMKLDTQLLALNCRFGAKLRLRVSLDHYSKSRHEELRGPHSWAPTITGLTWLSDQGFRVHMAGRTVWGDDEATIRNGFAHLFSQMNLNIDPHSPTQLILFPEMDEAAPVAEITTSCWSLLSVDPNSLMCASSRMVVKHKGADRPTIQACTLLPYDPRFALGSSLRAATSDPVALNHPHCSKFCVLGGGACSVSEVSST